MKSIFSALILIVATQYCRAQEDQKWNLHFQTTYIYQYKPEFHVPYSGQNSLSCKEEKQNSLTATLYAGLRLWKGAAIFVNPELAGGSGLSGALGMAGSSNGETFRVGDPAPALYLARAYFQQTIKIRSQDTTDDDDANQLGGKIPQRYFRFQVGKMSLGDVFDNNEYSNSPRTQFMNWSLMNTGSWDYAANVRGYTYAAIAQLQLKQMNYKIAMALLPRVANGPDLNTNFNDAYALNAEITRTYAIKGKTGNLRLLYFYNTANFGKYKQAIAAGGNTDTPDIVSTRRYGRSKAGLGINMDQQLGKYTGIFAKAGWNDGKTETWAFTEIDRTVCLGISFDGKGWNREGDNGGIAFVANGISPEHRDYLAHGGYGFIVGDSKLNYAPEFITEIYYSFKPINKELWLTGDYQFAMNPGYNSDRGPVNIFSFRLHVAL